MQISIYRLANKNKERYHDLSYKIISIKKSTA